MDFQEQFDNAISTYAEKNQYGVSMIPAHAHTGTDSLRVDFGNLANRTRFILYRIVQNDVDTEVAGGVGGDFVMPFSGYVTDVGATVDTAGTTGSTTINIKKNTVTILKTKITINSGSKTSRSASVPPIIDETNRNFITGDIFTFDVDGISSTPAQGLTVFINVTQVNETK